jgi:hypothetical protein
LCNAEIAGAVARVVCWLQQQPDLLNTQSSHWRDTAEGIPAANFVFSSCRGVSYPPGAPAAAANVSDWCTHAWSLGCLLLVDVLGHDSGSSLSSRSARLREAGVVAAVESSGECPLLVGVG